MRDLEQFSELLVGQEFLASVLAHVSYVPTQQDLPRSYFF